VVGVPYEVEFVSNIKSQKQLYKTFPLQERQKEKLCWSFFAVLEFCCYFSNIREIFFVDCENVKVLLYSSFWYIFSVFEIQA